MLYSACATVSCNVRLDVWAEELALNFVASNCNSTEYPLYYVHTMAYSTYCVQDSPMQTIFCTEFYGSCIQYRIVDNRMKV